MQLEEHKNTKRMFTRLFLKTQVNWVQLIEFGGFHFVTLGLSKQISIDVFNRPNKNQLTENRDFLRIVFEIKTWV